MILEISFTGLYVPNFLINVSNETWNSIFVSVAIIFWLIIRANAIAIIDYIS